MTLTEAKNKVAREKGYSNWVDFYDWIARERELPSVVAQLIEDSMEEAAKIYAESKWDEACTEIKTQLRKCWTFDEGQQHTHNWHTKEDFISAPNPSFRS